MAAKPIERFVKRQIQDQGGWPRILERIASGETFTEIANTLRRPDTGQGISFEFFRRLLHQDPEREPAIREAKRVRAEAWADQAKAYSESVPASRDEVAKGRVLIDTRLRLAALADREGYGEAKAGVSVTVQVPVMHLEGLRHRMVEASKPLAEYLVGPASSADALRAPVDQEPASRQLAPPDAAA